MHFDIESVMVIVIVVTGLSLFIQSATKPQQKANKTWASFCASIFPVFVLVLVLRSFVVEPFRIPSGSMLPGLEPGDFILVNKFSYGLSLPVVHYRLPFFQSQPQRGDVAVFRYPPDPSRDYVKRIIGLPGDTIRYNNKTVYINGEMFQYDQHNAYESAYAKESLRGKPLRVREIISEQKQHDVLWFLNYRAPEGEWRVPPSHYFVMGDNRDNSNDSRMWGPVPADNLVGKVFLIWMNWDMDASTFDFSRIGRAVF